MDLNHESISSREELRKFIHKELILYLPVSGLLHLSLKWDRGLGGTFDPISYLVQLLKSLLPAFERLLVLQCSEKVFHG